MTRTDATRLFGTQQPPVQGRVLRAGPLEARLENGNLRYIRYHGHEVLRAISYVVRDRNWGTLTPEISRLGIEETRSGFHVTYLAGYSNDGADLTVETRIQGASSGRLTFTARAVAGQDFETNRCGFTVLHPINGLAGAPVTVEHCDGSVEETVFPELIEPWQPFKSIRALTHAPAAHLKACCRMEGDDFEMEDQRNWSDASFKTYVRPLELPWPYVVPASSELTQAVDLQIEVTGSARAAGRIGRSDALSPVDITVNGPTGATFPRIGLLVSPEDVARALGSVGLLSDIGPQAILCHFDPTALHGVEDLRAFRELQQAFPADFDLEYVVACDGDLDAEFARLAEMIAESGLEPASLAVCPSVDRQSTPPGTSWPDCPPLEDIYRAARKAFPRTVLGGGMFSFFTELNRKRPPIGLLDFVTHATNPIVHAADDESVMETLETLPHITRSARAIIGADMPYRLGPTTIGMRQNPYGARTFPNPNEERICMSSDDPRQRGLFAAAWTLGYAAAIAPAGLDQWVPSAFAGSRGVVTKSGDDLLPIGRLVKCLARLSGLPCLTCSTDDPRSVAALGVATGGQPTLLMANLTGRPVEVRHAATATLGPYETVWP